MEAIKPSFRHLAGPVIGHQRLSVRHLEVFWAVMRTGSQSGAAELLGISQPAVSKMLSYVEQRTEITLFFRSRGKLIPSDEAHIFFHSIEEIFERVYKTETLLDDLRHRAAGEISVAFAPGIGGGLIGSFLAAFREAHPLSHVRVKLLNPPVILERTTRREIDIGVYHGPMGDVSVTSVVLAEDVVVCILPRGHRLCEADVVTPADLRSENILSGAPIGPETWMHALHRALNEHGLRCKPLIESIHPHLLYEFVSKGLGIALAPPVPVLAEQLGVVVKPFEPTIKAPLFAVMPVGRPPAQTATSLIRSMQKVLEGLSH